MVWNRSNKLGKAFALTASLFCLSVLVVWMREADNAPEAVEDATQVEPFACNAPPADWQRAQAVTPDVVPPCFTGSGGLCAAGFVYVNGTGWCKPRD